MRNIPSGWESRVVPTPSSSPGPTFSFLKRNVPLKKFMEVFLILHRYFRKKNLYSLGDYIILSRSYKSPEGILPRRDRVYHGEGFSKELENIFNVHLFCTENT